MNYFQLLDRLIKIYDKFEGQAVDSSTIFKKIKQCIPFKECRIISISTLGLFSNEFSVSGEYDPVLDELGKKSIIIELAFPKSKTEFQFDNSDLTRQHWFDFCEEIVSILGHEFIHMHQFRRRNFNWPMTYKSSSKSLVKKEVQEYYGDSDEIDAYAFMAAASLISYDVMRNKTYSRHKLFKNRVYKTYTRVFDKKDPVVLKFEKLTLRYYKKLEQQYHATTHK